MESSKYKITKLMSFGEELLSKHRSSRSEVFCKKGVPINFAKFTGKHLYHSLFFNKVAGLSHFPVNFAKFLRTPFLQNSSGRLLLDRIN